jgi:hypothetical protein
LNLQQVKQVKQVKPLAWAWLVDGGPCCRRPELGQLQSFMSGAVTHGARSAPEYLRMLAS